MKRHSHSKSVPPPRTSGTAPTVANNNNNSNNNDYMNTFDSAHPYAHHHHQAEDWPYSRLDTSPPPPYSSREGSHKLIVPPSSLGITETHPANRSHHHRSKAPFVNRVQNEHRADQRPETRLVFKGFLKIRFGNCFFTTVLNTLHCWMISRESLWNLK